MQTKNRLNTREISLFALLNSALSSSRPCAANSVDIGQIRYSINSINDPQSKRLRSLSMVFIEKPRDPQRGFERVLSPFSINFTIDREGVPQSNLTSCFAAIGGLELANSARCFLAVLSYLSQSGMISGETFRRSIEQSLKSGAKSQIKRALDDFPNWAVSTLKSCPYLSYDESEAACSDFLSSLPATETEFAAA
jgi:hypothetical protein